MHVLRINDVRKTYAAIKLLQKALPMHRFGLCCTVLRRRVQSKHRAPCNTHKLGLEWHQSVRVGPHVSLAEPVVDALSLGSDGDRPALAPLATVAGAGVVHTIPARQSGQRLGGRCHGGGAVY